MFSVVTYFEQLTKTNPVAAGMLSVYGLGVLTYLFKDIPLRVYHFIKEQLTTTLTINSQDSIYYEFLGWIGKHKMHGFMRTYNLSTTGWWDSGDTFMTVGYGTTIFRAGGGIVFLDRHQIEANATSQSKEIITLTALGRSSKVFYNIFDEIVASKEEVTTTYSVYHFAENNWRITATLPKRSLDTIALPGATKDSLLHHLNTFQSDKDWYLLNGVPYRTGIMLQGPPGTGKTSLITAVCSEYNRDCYILDPSNLNDTGLLIALSKVPNGMIVAIEDIDTHFSQRSKIETTSSDMTIKLGPSLAGILNALDGIACGTDRIVFATTNHPEKLDPALVREGRFNLKLEIGYMTNETLHAYVGRLYPTLSKSELAQWNVMPNIPPCKVQQLVFDNRQNPQLVLEQVATKQTAMKQMRAGSSW
jgi:mitochondrial chaperone BCS1